MGTVPGDSPHDAWIDGRPEMPRLGRFGFHPIERDLLARELAREPYRPDRDHLTAYREREPSAFSRSQPQDLSPGTIITDPLASALAPPDSSALLRDEPQANDAARVRMPAADRRAFHPLARNAPAIRTNGVPADFSPSPSVRSSGTIQVFHQPHTVLPCIARTVRREVLFAKRKARGSHKRKRRTWMSTIGC